MNTKSLKKKTVIYRSYLSLFMKFNLCPNCETHSNTVSILINTDYIKTANKS